MYRVTKVKALPGYRLALSFDTGESGEVDLSHLMDKGVFRQLVDPAEFAKVMVGEYGEVRWPCDIDLCPDSLYLDAVDKTAGSAPQPSPPGRGLG